MTSVHQKQPVARVTVSIFEEAEGAGAAGLGSAAVEVNKAPTRAARVRRKERDFMTR